MLAVGHLEFPMWGLEQGEVCLGLADDPEELKLQCSSKPPKTPERPEPKTQKSNN